MTSVADRITASTDNWKRKLLDLTKRNRALNFRVNKVSTVTVVDEQPAEVFRHLYLAERSMKFRPAEKPDVAGATRSTVDTLVGRNPGGIASSVAADELFESDEEDDSALKLDFAVYDPSALGQRHTDDILQTASLPDALDKSLRRLDEQARLSIEEQGVNTLFLALGMLHYTEAVDSARVLRAPLVLLPVELSRRSARSGYTVSATDDDPLVNPALVELLRREYGIETPALPDSAVIPDDYDLQDFLAGMSAAVAAKAGWGIKTDIYLGLFSFQKFVMYKDLEANSETLRRHRLIKQLVTRDGTHIVGLPPAIRAMDLDAEYPPEKTDQVVDADSSQLRAVAAVARGHDIVIEGPPGTGKSQTITNLIAQALSADKSVLFVAEKMAALSVVHDRLVSAGMGEFCLELHSSKANKRAVMRELGATLEASLQSTATTTASTQRLPRVRAALSDYVKAVHTPGSLGISPYKAYGELGKVLSAPRVSYSGPIDAPVTPESLGETARALDDLAVSAREIGIPSAHPWRDATKTFYSEDDLETIRELLADVLARLEEIGALARRVQDAFGLPPVRTFADADTAASIARVLSRSPGAPAAVLGSDAWNAPPAGATNLIERGREYQRLKSRIEKQFTRDVLDQEHAADIAYVEKKSEGLFAFFAVLDGRYRVIKRRWKSYRLPSFQGTLLDQGTEMKVVDRFRAENAALTAAEAEGKALFGALWEGVRSPWDVLAKYVEWVVEFRSVCVRHGLSDKAREVATQREPNIQDVEQLRSGVAKAAEVLSRLTGVAGWPMGYLEPLPLSAIVGRLTSVRDNITLAPRWAAFETARRVAAESLAGELIPAALKGELAFRDLASAFRRAFWQKWITAIVRDRPALESFQTLTHEQRVAEFRDLDKRVLRENRGSLIGRLRDRAQLALQQDDAMAAMPFLRRELARQRGLSPLRRTMHDAGPAIRAIKPCFLMSPLTVAQLLDGSVPPFDVIIFDEASQLPPEDAVGAIMRGTQLVVVGDPKQLPPTNFFSLAADGTGGPVGEDGQPIVEDSESILEQFMGAGVPMSRLKWHYRSTHESLISFSNVQFYDADLYTFPSVATGNETGGLQLEYVPDGVYEGKGLNAIEARRVADEVVRFAKEQLERTARGEPTQSLGVGTFNLRQQLAIQDELEQRRRADPSIESFFDRGVREPFFVKNLENIQGDERSVIFISVTYAKAADGRLRFNFGPLNGENGWRRLNVLVTRARERMRVFSSMRGEEINAAGTTSRGANLLREFLIFAERGKLESVSASLGADAESPFEHEVFTELTNRGFRVVPQVGTAGYRIDLGVLDDAAPGRFLCGIECDGVAYHSSETARDRDRLRQQVLEARGWRIHRVWSTDWFKDRPGQIARLVTLIEQSRTDASREDSAERHAKERDAEEFARHSAQAARSALQGVAAESVLGPYKRPILADYIITAGEGRYAGRDVLIEPTASLARAINEVIYTEAPIHETDLLARVASQWGVRLGARIRARLVQACRSVEREREFQRRGEYYWAQGRVCVPRNRAGLRVPADRIAPEEWREAVLAVLASGHAFTREDLTIEVRSALGFGRSSAAIEQATQEAVQRLLSEGRVGEGARGVRIRA